MKNKIEKLESYIEPEDKKDKPSKDKSKDLVMNEKKFIKPYDYPFEREKMINRKEYCPNMK